MLVNSPARRAATQRRHFAACAAVLLALQQQRKFRDRNKQRKRLDWQAHVNDIGDAIFKSAYRLSIDAFNALLSKILP
jgi:hypothetical protein